MADTDIRSFSIDSTLELIADHFTGQTPDSLLFRTASVDDRVNLSAGLLSSTSGPANVLQAIVGGVIDEYEITITPDNLVGTVRGRDPSANILDGYFDGLFARPTGPFVHREVLPNAIPFVLIAPSSVGRHKASDIARQIVASVGLDLRWEVRDYELEKDFRSSGRVIDSLRELVQPWTLVEPFKADIFLQGSTVIIRHRQLPTAPIPADYTLDLTSLRRSTLQVRKRRLKKIGKVTLRGRKEPPTLHGGGVSSNKIVPTGGDISVVDGGGEEERTITHQAFDDGGNLVSITTTVETYRMPERVLIKSIKSTFTGGPGIALTLTIRETIDKEWEDPVYDSSGAANSPLISIERLSREGISDADDNKIFRVLETEQTNFSYDEQRFLTGSSTTKKAFNFTTNLLEFSTLTVKTVHDIGALLVEEITEQYAFDSGNSRWVIRTRDTQTSGGHRPGGFGRGASTAGAQTAGSAAVDNIVLEQTFSTDVDATPVEYTNENLKLEDLQFIMAQFAATTGWYEFEVLFGGVAMPWFRRGSSVKFTGVQLEQGVGELNLPTMLITEIRTRYSEDSPSASYVMECRAFAWSP